MELSAQEAAGTLSAGEAEHPTYRAYREVGAGGPPPPPPLCRRRRHALSVGWDGGQDRDGVTTVMRSHACVSW
jgi:hypothetical protein